MGDYATTTELTARVGTQRAAELTTDSGSTPDASKLTDVIAAAEGELNGYLAPRVAVPVDISLFAQAAGVLNALTLDLAVPRLYLLRTVVPPNIERQRELAIEWLMAFTEGKVDLPTATPAESSTSREPDAEFGYDTRISSRENMEGL